MLTKNISNFVAMKKTFLFIWALLGIHALTGCGNSHRDPGYRVTCTIDNTLKHDSATLLVLEDGYNQLRVCGTCRARGGVFTFDGQTDRPKVALIRWDDDTVQPFYFVLEPGQLSINITPQSWTSRAALSMPNTSVMSTSATAS